MTDIRKKKPKSMKLNTGESSRSQGMVGKDFGENQTCILFPPNSKKTAGVLYTRLNFIAKTIWELGNSLGWDSYERKGKT